MSSSPLKINAAHTLSEDKYDQSELDLIGQKSLLSSNEVLLPPQWNYIDIQETTYGPDTNEFVITEAGFYSVGCDLTITASEINDFSLEVAIFVIRNNAVGEKILQTNVRTLFKDKQQRIELTQSVNLDYGDKLVLGIKHSKGIVKIKKGALFAYKTDAEVILPKSSGLQHYYKCDEYGNLINRADSVGNTYLDSHINTLGNFNGTKITNGANDYLSTTLLDFTNASGDYNDGFTILVRFKIEELINRGIQPGYVSLLSRSLGSSLNEGIDLYSLYLDTWTWKFVFTFLDINGVKRDVISPVNNAMLSSFTTFSSEFVALTFNRTTGHLKIIVNGIIIAALKIDGFYQTLSQIEPLLFGKRSSSHVYIDNSTFYISDIGVFNRGLVTKEIVNIYDGSSIAPINNNPEFIQRLYSDTSDGSSITLPLSALSVEYISPTGVIDTVQNKLNTISAQLASISSGNVSTFSGTIILTDWILDSNRSVYKLLIPSLTHNVINPWDVIVQVIYNGLYIVGESMCEVEIDAATKDIYLYVNDVPDGRFVGRFIVMGY